MSTITKLGSRLTRDTAVFTGATAITVILAFVTVAVVTRYLTPPEFGQLALFYFFAALLTVVYNLGSMQGTLLRVFGSAGEEEVDDEEASRDRRDNVAKRRTLTTGLLLTVLIAAAGTLAIALLADDASRVIVGETASGAVLLAAASGGAGAIWRLTSNVARFDRRVWRYAAITNLRPALVLGCVWYMLETQGAGVRHAITGTLVGTGLAILLCLVATRKNYAWAVNPGALRPILVAGLPYMPLVVAMWIIQNVDLYVLSMFAADDEVGVYRLANRVASVSSYVISGLMIAWIPVVRSTIFDAARRERGVGGLGNLMLSYYNLLAIWLVLGLAAGAGVLAQVAPPAYGDAADLIPLLGLGFVTYGFFVVVYRVGGFPDRRKRYVQTAIMAAVLFMVTALLLTPPLGGYGAGIAVVLAFAAASAVLLYLSERGPAPLNLEWWRSGAALVVGLALYAVTEVVPGFGQAPGLIADTAVIVLYPALLVGLRIIPRDHLDPLAAIGRSLLPARGRQRELVDRLVKLPARERTALRSMVRGPARARDASRPAGPEATNASDAVRGLRRIAALKNRGGQEAVIASFLDARNPIVERDELWHRLRATDVDPADLHEMEATVHRLRRLPGRAWEEADRQREAASST